MDTIWETQLFASIEELVEAVNARGLTADQFKVVPEPSASGRGRFHLLFQAEAEPDPLMASIAVRESGEVQALVEEERHEAVDEAEAIIHDAQHDRD
ncbi:MAG TPA: hypothetical protein VGT61_08035 [Thermomicrobiales bacterium]|jgi:hypothetical protein|nr:hypothetical protein [Thermomicrobiales bacterium]